MASRKETAAGIVGLSVLAKSPAARRALVGLLRQGGRTLGPWGLAAWLAYEGYVRRDDIRKVANEIAERLPPAAAGQGGDPTFSRNVFGELTNLPITPFGMDEQIAAGIQSGFGDVVERQRAKGRRTKKAANKFQKAVGKAYKAVKKQAGKTLPAKAFKQATKIASRANPGTKSRIGKGKSFAQRTARKIRKSVWGTIRRKK